MKLIIILLISFIGFTNRDSISQTVKKDYNPNINLELKNKYTEPDKELNLNSVKEKISESKKSPALALLFSLILPGAGHYYLNRMDVGKYFLGADAVSWIGLISLNVYGDDVRDESRTFSVQHAQVTGKDSKDDDFYTNIGSFANVYDYNNDKLQRGEYYLLYDVNSYYWNWDALQNQNIYESQRKSSERIYNSRIIFSSLLIANRVVSGISAYLLAGKKDKKSSSMMIEPELLYRNDMSFDGVKINLTKNF